MTDEYAPAKPLPDVRASSPFAPLMVASVRQMATDIARATFPAFGDLLGDETPDCYIWRDPSVLWDE